MKRNSRAAPGRMKSQATVVSDLPLPDSSSNSSRGTDVGVATVNSDHLICLVARGGMAPSPS
jgi:hypothetical protein